MKKGLLLLLIFHVFMICRTYAQCNGFPYLCDRTYDDVAYLTTHNAFNDATDGFLLPNQNNTITQQLNDGVRALMIDVYDVNGVATVYHGFSYLGNAPLTDKLDEIKAFLYNNPQEIVTLILENYASPALVETALSQSGLLSYLFVKDTTTILWPTLQQMINSGKRLVIFSEADDATPSQPWYHYVWDYAVETNFTVHDTSEFNCSYNRGNPDNPLFIFNHFITDATLGIGVEAQATMANANPYLLNRIYDCMNIHNKFPNFITVDFYERGDSKAAVDIINSGYWAGIQSPETTSDNISIGPNPCRELLNVEVKEPVRGKGLYLQLTNLFGQEIFYTEIKQQHISLDLSNVKSGGIYFVKISSSLNNSCSTRKIVVLR